MNKLILLGLLALSAGSMGYKQKFNPNMLLNGEPIYAKNQKSTEGIVTCNLNATPDDHLVPDYNDCHNFYYCTLNDENHGPVDKYSAVKFNCPPGLAFSDEIDACDWEDNVALCSEPLTRPPTTPAVTTTTTEEATTTTTEAVTTTKADTTPTPTEAETTTTTTEAETTTTTEANLTPVCPDGWELNEESCYLFKRTRVYAASVAESRCNRQGGRLVEIETAEEEAFIVARAEELAKPFGNWDLANGRLDYWLGGRLNDDGEWTWASTGAAMEYTDFAQRPAALFGECLQLTKVGPFFPWPVLDTFRWARNAGWGCTMDLDNGYICERSADWV